MKFLLHALIALALGFAAFASVLPTPEDNPIVQIFEGESTNVTISPDSDLGPDPSFEYDDGGAFLQVWVGKAKTNVGPVIGSPLYSTIWHTLDNFCPAVDGTATCISGNKFLCFETDSTVNGEVQQSNTCMWGLEASWHSQDVRKLLIGLVASTLEAQTKPDVGGTSNCYMMDSKKACNVGNAVRVNLPFWSQRRNFMHVMIENTASGFGNWDCCGESNVRQRVDVAVDGLGGEISEAFKKLQKPFTRDTRCIIDGWKVCGE